MHQKIQHIKQLVEHVLGHKIKLQANANDLLLVDTITSSDELALIKHYLNNPHLVNVDLVADLVGRQLKKYPLSAIANLPVVNSWLDYLNKLEQILEQVKYRQATHYEYHDIMPTKQQLMQLQQECWDLTEQWYGSGSGNLSCFYSYFVAMSQAAGVTSFEYDKIGKFISADHYLALINLDQRRVFYKNHEQYNHDFILQGGIFAQGRSVIDATSISNIFYYKTAQLIFNFKYAKQLVVQALGLENYGQLAYSQRLQLWQLLQQHYSDNTQTNEQSIFYRFMQYFNARPGEFFNYFAAELPEAGKVEPRLLHDIVKIAGLQSGHLILLSRNIVDNWVPKRYFNLQWVRRHDLKQVNAKNDVVTVRTAGASELVRILPNELPYAPGHGLSLCGDGLIDGLDQHDKTVYEWNTPTDQRIDLDNWPRDIEKLFKEFKFFNPALKKNQLLLGEKMVTMFHNSMAYSTIHTTQHTHIFCLGIDKFLLYTLPPTVIHAMPMLEATIDVVQVGSNVDAFYLRVNFNDIENEPLIAFLLRLNEAMFMHFGGIRELDIHLQLFATEEGNYVFIYEPHALLCQLDNDRFLNPYNNSISRRRPQFLQPEGNDIQYITNEMANGLGYCRKFFDDTCKPGTRKFIDDYLKL